LRLIQAGIDIIKESEGCSLTAYQDQRGIWTIGYGSTHGVVQGMTVTADEAQARLLADLQDTCDLVQKIVPSCLNDNQYSATVSFTFNVGSGNLQQSTFLRCMKAFQWADAAEEILRWNKINGIESDGLARRREREKSLFLAPIATGSPTPQQTSLLL
jgi:lysozyme